MAEPTPITREQLLLALRPKLPASARPDVAVQGADWIADAIRIHDLESVIAGRHLGKPVTFEAAFTEVFGVRLDGLAGKAK